MYKLLKDKVNEFQCDIKLEGTSASTAKVRLFLEGDGCEYSFPGEIEGQKCVVPIGRLKKFVNLLESGKIRLEVVAEDTLFTPYESTYQLDESKKVTVEVKDNVGVPKKAVVEVKIQNTKPTPPAKTTTSQIAELKNYFETKTNFDGSLASFRKIMRNEDHRNVFNDACEYYGLDKSTTIKQLLK
jgi:TusA-related sulfurtransferase